MIHGGLVRPPGPEKEIGMRNLLLIVPLLYSTVAAAQSSIDLFTLSGMYGFPSSYTPPLDGKAGESGILTNLKAPVKLSDKTLFYNDLTYFMYNIDTDLDTEPVEYLTSMRLHAFIIQTGIVQSLSDRNKIQLLLVPRYTTDFKGSDRKSWQWGGIGLYERRFNDRLLMRYGALFNMELFGPLVVPLIYADWQWNERWSMVGLFPINLKINYKVSERLVTGLSHFGFITTYRIGQEEFRGDYVERNSIDETLFVRWRIGGNLHLETRLGYSLARVYEQYAEGEKMDFRLSIFRFGDERVQKNADFNSGAIASVRLVYSLPLNQ